MTPPYLGHTPTPEAPPTAAGKLIDFRQEARRRAIVAELASGRFCAFCLLRRLIERYPLFFEVPAGTGFAPDDAIAGNVILSASEGAARRGSKGRAAAPEGLAAPARLRLLRCAQDDRMSVPILNGQGHHRAGSASGRRSWRDEARGSAQEDGSGGDEQMCASNDADAPQEGRS